MSDTVEYERMRPAQIVAAQRRAPVAFIPVGPLEWHGPHLPLGTDGLHAHAIAVEVARRVGGVVLPALFLGSDSLQGPGTGESVEHLGLPPDALVRGMDYPGNPVRSTYVDEGVVGLAVRELVRALKDEPYAVIVIINGHGAPSHQRALRRIAIEETVPDGVRVLYSTAWVAPEPGRTDPGHADRLETSLLMALEPYTVELGRLPARPARLPYAQFGIVDGPAFDGRPQADLSVPDEHDPRNSSADEGARIVEQEVARLMSAIAEVTS